MIKFENGEFTGGTFDGIFDSENYESLNYNMYDTLLSEDCWILSFPKDNSGIRVANVCDEDICFIPSIGDIDNFDYDLFWESDITWIFSDIYELHDFALEYAGEHFESVAGIYDYIRKCLEKKEVIGRYMCTCRITEDCDNKLYNELQDLIVEKGVRPDTAFATLKMMLLNQYTIQFEEVVPRLES